MAQGLDTGWGAVQFCSWRVQVPRETLLLEQWSRLSRMTASGGI